MTRKLEDLKYKIRNLNYRGRPLFGRDSDPQNTSEFVALAGTLLFWLLAFIFFLFARPFEKKQEFKTVQIVLSSTPVAKTEKKESASSSAAAQKAQSIEKKIEKQDVKTVKENPAHAKSKNEKIVSDKPAAKNPPKNVDKAVAKSSESKTSKDSANNAAPVELSKSVEELMAEQMNAQKKTTQDFNWNAFEDSDDVSSASENQSRKVETASSMSHEVAAKATSDGTGVTSSAQSDNIGEVNTVGAETSKVLEGIKAVESGSAGQFKTNVKDSNGNGSAVSVSDGFGHSGRYIISSEPIDISDKNAETITSNLTFEITFKIQPSGVVLKSDIEFESKANVILTNAVIDEIKTIIARWTFSSASNISIAKFSLAIQRK